MPDYRNYGCGVRKRDRTRSTRLPKLVKKQNYRCYWCDCTIVKLGDIDSTQIRVISHHHVVWNTPDGIRHALIASVDHIIPVSRGGEDDADNLVAACKWCNEGRDNKSVFLIS